MKAGEPPWFSLPPPIHCLRPGALQVEVVPGVVPSMPYFTELASDYFYDYNLSMSAKVQTPQRIRLHLNG